MQLCAVILIFVVDPTAIGFADEGRGDSIGGLRSG